MYVWYGGGSPSEVTKYRERQRETGKHRERESEGETNKQKIVITESVEELFIRHDEMMNLKFVEFLIFFENGIRFGCTGIS